MHIRLESSSHIYKIWNKYGFSPDKLKPPACSMPLAASYGLRGASRSPPACKLYHFFWPEEEEWITGR